MASSLQGVLAGIPGLGGYLAGQQNDQQTQMGQLQQVGALQGILAQQQKQQQQHELKGVLSRVAQQAGGDPAKMGPLLLQTGHPELMALGKNMLPKPSEPKLVTTVAADGVTPISKFVNPNVGDVYPTAKPSDTKGTWSEPYNLNGVLVQKNSVDGQVRTAVTREPNIRIINPPAPSVKDIIDPLDKTRLIAVDTRVFNEDKYKAGDKSGVIGVSGKEPSHAKRDEEKQSGIQNLKDTVGMLDDAYSNLDRMGTGVSPNQGAMKNVWERASASGLGQTVAGAVGTKAQTERDKIAMARANLMAAMKQATGMSAQALNSNAELMFYLQAATDPSKSREANRAALSYMDKRFKLGLGIKGDPKALANPNSSGAIAPSVPPPPEGFKPL